MITKANKKSAVAFFSPKIMAHSIFFTYFAIY